MVHVVPEIVVPAFNDVSLLAREDEGKKATLTSRILGLADVMKSGSAGYSTLRQDDEVFQGFDGIIVFGKVGSIMESRAPFSGRETRLKWADSQ